MKKKLMVLGSLGEFVQLIQRGRERGIEVFVCDRYPDGPGKRIADKSCDIDAGDTQKAAELCRQEGIDGVITSFSDYLFECMVKICDEAGLKCYIKPQQLQYYRNKSVMKGMFQRLGIGTPRHVCLKQDFQGEELEEIHFPAVIKPVDRYGSRGVFVVNSVEEVRRHFDESCTGSEIKEIIVEEYNEGYEFNMMAWVHRGKVRVISIADREKSPIGGNEIPVSSRNVYPSRYIHEVYDEAKEILQKIADFTGQKDGALSMQFFWSEGSEIQVCEVAGRFFGYEHELVEYSGGLILEDILLDYIFDEESLGRLLENHNPFMASHSAVLYFHGRERRIRNQESARKLASMEGVKEAWLFYEDGEQIVKFGPKPYAARYYITAESRKELDRLTEEIYKKISMTDECGREVLYPNRMTDYKPIVSKRK